MLLLVLVVAYASAALRWSPQLLADRRWAAASPRLGLLWWHCVLAVLVSSILLVAMMAVVSVQHLHVDVSHLLHACAVAAWQGLAHPGVAVTTGAGLLGLVLLGHLVRVAASSAASSRRVRLHQRDGLALLDVPRNDGRVSLLASDSAFAYCIPGNGGRIVISTAAAAELEPEELRAVVAHEHAHLRGRHHVTILLVHVLARALPIRPLRVVQTQVATLLEMSADDRATSVASRAALLSALLRLASAGHASPGLAADGGSTVARALRLADPPRVSPYPVRAALACAALTFAVVPWLLGGAPVLLALTGHCEG